MGNMRKVFIVFSCSCMCTCARVHMCTCAHVHMCTCECITNQIQSVLCLIYFSKKTSRKIRPQKSSAHFLQVSGTWNFQPNLFYYPNLLNDRIYSRRGVGIYIGEWYGRNANSDQTLARGIGKMPTLILDLRTLFG